ncbi:MAG: succinate dehydrogenase cytochrome b subunit [bacterium]|nr:succinate dehydrogenase cytochrome b subunit [bacterium]
MNWILRLLASSVGKKIFMAVSGVLLLFFLIAHLAGNLTLVGGKEMLALYAHTLHSFPLVVVAMEIGLGAIFLAHILLGLTLFLQNRKAKGSQYAVSSGRGGKTWASATMPYSGLLILVFLIIHLSDFTVKNYVNGWTGEELVEQVLIAFTGTARILYYIAMVIIVGIHVSHGFWSLFQSLGWTNSRTLPVLKIVGKVVGVAFAIGFGILPLIAFSLAK